MLNLKNYKNIYTVRYKNYNVNLLDGKDSSLLERYMSNTVTKILFDVVDADYSERLKKVALSYMSPFLSDGNRLYDYLKNCIYICRCKEIGIPYLAGNGCDDIHSINYYKVATYKDMYHMLYFASNVIFDVNYKKDADVYVNPVRCDIICSSSDNPHNLDMLMNISRRELSSNDNSNRRIIEYVNPYPYCLSDEEYKDIHDISYEDVGSYKRFYNTKINIVPKYYINDNRYTMRRLEYYE